MWSLRVRATTSPSGATQIAVLYPRSSARSYSDACTNAPVSAAMRAANCVVGPSGMASAFSCAAATPSSVMAK